MRGMGNDNTTHRFIGGVDGSHDFLCRKKGQRGENITLPWISVECDVALRRTNEKANFAGHRFNRRAVKGVLDR